MSSYDRQPRTASPDSEELIHEVWPLDIAILRTLPNDDQMLGGVHYVGRRIADVAAELGEHVTSSQVNSRMRVCRMNGLVVARPASGGRVWQRTQKAVNLIATMDGAGADVAEPERNGEIEGPLYG